jgi:hypothetical protein
MEAMATGGSAECDLTIHSGIATIGGRRSAQVDRGVSWLRDILLESPMPPANYLPDRRSRLSIGSAVLRGRQTNLEPRQMHDLGPAYPLLGAGRVVSGERIVEELEADLRTVNPPIVQGWMVIGLVLAAAVSVFGASLGGDRSLAAPLAGLSILVLGALVVVVATAMKTVELRGDHVVVRSWLGVRLGRKPLDLGPAAHMRAQIDGSTLLLEGPAGQVRISIRGWPGTAQRDVIEELPIWGVTAPWSRRPSRRAQRRQRRSEATNRVRATRAVPRRGARRR